MDVLSKIYAVLTWMVRQGRLVVITGMLVGLAALLVNAIVNISPADGDPRASNLTGVLALVVGVVCVVILVTLWAETFQKENELKYGQGKHRRGDDDE